MYSIAKTIINYLALLLFVLGCISQVMGLINTSLMAFSFSLIAIFINVLTNTIEG